jgi:penicillin-binding protein 2
MNKETISKISRIIRMSALVVLMITLTFLCVIRLLQIQIVNAGIHSARITETFVAEQTIQAVRGQITDNQGRILNTNEIVYKIILQRAFLPFGEENEIIAGILNVLIKHEQEWLDSVPITMEQPFQFKNVPEDELDRFKRRLGLNYDATVENCIRALAENYKINITVYDDEMLRFIGGVRYEMERRDFSFQNRYTFAEDICMDIIIELKERALLLKGVDIIEEPIRLYLDGTMLPHIRGRINAINEQQYTALRDSGYSLNDVIGFFGLEESMESVLRGENGIRQITRDSSWEVISDEITKAVRAGNSVKLTIDTEFQHMIERILADHMNWISQRKNWPNPSRPFTETTSGSIVVLDATTGEILALATNPSFDLADYVDLMLADATGDPPFKYQPLLDRSIAHGYRPGSSFKAITGAAGLIHGVVDRNSTVHCSGQYTRFSDFRPFCWNRRGCGTLNSISALHRSCNSYYYDVGWRLGINKLAETAHLFGVGSNLNIDTAMFPGRMTTPEIYEALMGYPISEGDTIQAAIGQSETLMTPLHMATVAMTIANNGVRYRPYLVDSVWNYDLTELVYQTQREIAADFSEGNEHAFKTIRDGMHQLGLHQGTGIFNFLPERPAFKTGTAQTYGGNYNSTVLGYYPFENPKIAFAVVLEYSEYSSRAIRNIIDAYFYGHYEPLFFENGDTMYDWVRWSQPRQPLPGRYID